MKQHKRVYLIEKLTRGHANGTTPGTFLNSMTWRECGTVAAENDEIAFKRACHIVGSSQVRVSEDQHGECL